jgi:hypothetical protein
MGVVVEADGAEGHGVRQRRDLLRGEREGGEGVVGGRGREGRSLWRRQSTTVGSERVSEEVDWEPGHKLISMPTRRTRGRSLRCGGTHVTFVVFSVFSQVVQPAEGHVGSRWNVIREPCRSKFLLDGTDLFLLAM